MKLSIKSAGLIDGEYKIILSNGDEIDKLRYISLEKELNSIGVIKIEALLMENNKQNKKPYPFGPND